MAKRPKAKKLLPMRARMDFRTIANPAAWHADGHGDAPPYHDQHDDGDTYYDHPDSEHNDVHIDEGGITRVFRGDPADLVGQSIARLEKLMTKFESGYRRRLQKLETRLVKLEAARTRR